jgi:hypothetical protein
VGRESLRLLLSLTPWNRTDPLPQCCRPCRLVIVPPHGGVADIGLSSYSPVRRRPATIVSDLKTSNNRFRAFNLGPRGT